MSSENRPTVALSQYATSIDHVAVAVRDLEESIRFYSEVLGFELKERRRTEGKATAMISAVMKAGPITVVLLEGNFPGVAGLPVRRALRPRSPAHRHRRPEPARDDRGAQGRGHGVRYHHHQQPWFAADFLQARHGLGHDVRIHREDGRRLLRRERAEPLRATGAKEHFLMPARPWM